MTPVVFLTAGICLILEALFSSSEIALVSADRAHIRRLAASGHRGARYVETFLTQPSRLLATTLLGTQISVVTSTVVITLWLYRHHPAHVELYLTLCLTPVIVTFGEIVPKAIMRNHANFFAPRMAVFLYFAMYLFAPGVAVLTRFAEWTQRRMGIELHHPLVTREEIETLVSAPSPTPTENPALPSQQQASDVTEGERSMISRILDLGDSQVSDVMVPLSDVTAAPASATVADLARDIADKKYSRIPIYRERLDQIVGVVHAFDVLKAAKSRMTAAELMRPPIFVPESTGAMELLAKLERARQGMAMVVDEYGGAIGVVTLEDILEEVVGEIEDEHDEAPSLITKEKDGALRVKARISVAQINRELTSHPLPESDDYESVAGLLLDRLRRIPRPGETLRLGPLTIEVTVASERRIEECLIRVSKPR